MRLYLNQVAVCPLKNLCMSRSVRPFYESRFWPAIKVLYKVHFFTVVQHFETSSLFYSHFQVWPWCSCSQKSSTLVVLLYLKFVCKRHSYIFILWIMPELVGAICASFQVINGVFVASNILYVTKVPIILLLLPFPYNST